MTPQEVKRRLGLLRQSITEVSSHLEDSDPAALLKAADGMGDAYHLALRGVMGLVYDEAAGVTVGNELFGARVYGVGGDGK